MRPSLSKDHLVAVKWALGAEPRNCWLGVLSYQCLVEGASSVASIDEA